MPSTDHTRCIRCNHPSQPVPTRFSECDEECTHDGWVNIFKPDGSNHPMKVITTAGDLVAKWKPQGRTIKVEGRLVTFTDKGALCQKCQAIEGDEE
jgi:hypothetical protein